MRLTEFPCTCGGVDYKVLKRRKKGSKSLRPPKVQCKKCGKIYGQGIGQCMNEHYGYLK